MAYYDKDSIKRQLEPEQIFDLLVEFGGEPIHQNNAIIATTICHNKPGEGSHKLYYYYNTELFQCYTGCENPSFDIFDLVIKVFKIQKEIDLTLYDAVRYVALYFGLSPDKEKLEEQEQLEDWEVFKRHDIEIAQFTTSQKLKIYDKSILNSFSYPIIEPWEKEGISRDSIKLNQIGYYPVGEQITIPHFDKEGNLVGIRGRFLASEDTERFGKYRPLMINHQLYNHPLSMNLYNLNNSKNNIKESKVAILVESEKSCMLYQSFFGIENDISVACCGRNLSNYQIDLLQQSGCKELIIAFDKEHTKIGDEDYYKEKKKLQSVGNKVKNYMKVSYIYDTGKLLDLKDSPLDKGPKVFEELLRNRLDSKGRR